MSSKHSAFGRGSRPLECRECGAKRLEGAQISARGLCRPCGHARNGDAQEQIQTGEGPFYDEWKRGVVEHAHRLISS